MNEPNTVEVRALRALKELEEFLAGDEHTETAFQIAYENVVSITTAIWHRRSDVLIER